MDIARVADLTGQAPVLSEEQATAQMAAAERMTEAEQALNLLGREYYQRFYPAFVREYDAFILKYGTADMTVWDSYVLAQNARRWATIHGQPA